MFIVNGEILSMKGTPELFRWYESQLKEIEKTTEGDYVVFSAHRKPRFETDDSGRKRRVQRYKAVPATSTYDNEEFGNQTWTYVPGANSVKNDNGMMIPISPKPFFIGHETSYDKKADKDIVFYLLRISEATAHGKIFHVDRKRDSIVEAQASALAAEAQYMLYSDSSPISPESTDSENAIRQLAISFGISNVSQLHIAEVRNNLWKEILKKEKTRAKGAFGFKGFIDEAKKVKDSSKRALVFSAVETGALRFENQKWYMHVPGSFDKPICSVAASQQKQYKEILANYIIENPEYLDLLTNAAAPKPEELSVDLTRSELIEECARKGWEKGPLYKMKSAELKQIVDNDIQPGQNEDTEE